VVAVGGGHAVALLLFKTFGNLIAASVFAGHKGDNLARFGMKRDPNIFFPASNSEANNHLGTVANFLPVPGLLFCVNQSRPFAKSAVAILESVGFLCGLNFLKIEQIFGVLFRYFVG
jgi:hypothetical protein